MSKTKSILNWEDIKGRLFLRLENRGKSMEVPDERISIPFLDLAVYIYCNWGKTHHEGVYVNRNHLVLWKQDEQDLFRTALENTFHKDNILVAPITALLSPAIANMIDHQGDLENDMIVLTNRIKEYGAAMLLNTKELKKLAAGLDATYTYCPVLSTKFLPYVQTRI